MNYFKNRFEEHGIHGLLSNLEKAVADYDIDLPDDGSERDTYERFIRVLNGSYWGQVSRFEILRLARKTGN